MSTTYVHYFYEYRYFMASAMFLNVLIKIGDNSLELQAIQLKINTYYKLNSELVFYS